MTSYGDVNLNVWVIGLLPDSTMPFPEPILTYNQWNSVANNRAVYLWSAHELNTYHVLEIILQQITLYLPGASDLDIKACACCRRCHVCFSSSEFCRTPHLPVRSSVCGMFIITSDHFVRNSELADRFNMVLFLFKIKDNNIKGNLMKCKSIGRHSCTYGIY